MIRRRRGAAMVELALTLPLIMLFLMGVIEFGMIMHDQVMLANGVQVGSRAAAIGHPVDEVKQETVAASTLPVTIDQVDVQYCQPQPGQQEQWQDASPLGNDQNGNNQIPANAMIKVTIRRYPHRMVTGNFFSALPGFQNGTFPMTASLVMRRQ